MPRYKTTDILISKQDVLDLIAAVELLTQHIDTQLEPSEI
jgi:hypothetical protein